MVDLKYPPHIFDVKSPAICDNCVCVWFIYVCIYGNLQNQICHGLATGHHSLAPPPQVPLVKFSLPTLAPMEGKGSRFSLLHPAPVRAPPARACLTKHRPDAHGTQWTENGVLNVGARTHFDSCKTAVQLMTLRVTWHSWSCTVPASACWLGGGCMRLCYRYITVYNDIVVYI